ncbi:hypothetical protein LBMAG56_22670 [Verrucomicrobiota bacterium]|nr:hypothetical protein LBMAG56_22670 [Verrucomicrobiota bacterium]
MVTGDGWRVAGGAIGRARLSSPHHGTYEYATGALETDAPYHATRRTTRSGSSSRRLWGGNFGKGMGDTASRSQFPKLSHLMNTKRLAIIL